MTAGATERELDEWMSRLAHGDRDAFTPLYRALLPRALRLARSKLGRSLGDDAAQTAMMNVFARASEFEPGRPVLPWFYAVLSNEVRATLRKNGRTASADGAPDDAPSDPSDPESALLDRELRRMIDIAIDSLDRESAEAIYALLGSGPRPDVEAATFRKRVSRAYTRLRVLLGGDDGP